jgi:integrase
MIEKRLSARAVATLKKPGRHRDGSGLCLSIDKNGRKRWTFMFRRQGRTQEIGLGSARTVSLGRARELATECRNELARGTNPLERREAERRARDGRKTFGACADAFLASKESSWRNPKHRAQWRMTLTEYAAPLRAMTIDEVNTEAVLSVLQPLWQAKPETASRLRGRIEAVIDSARVAGHIDERQPNPARWAGHLQLMLPKPAKLTRGHHAAMPYAEVPAFMAGFAGQESISALVLRYLIMTAARTGEVIGAQWNEFDLESKLWIIPAARMKAGREHRVPLSGPAMAIIGKLAAARQGEFVFPGQKRGKPLSNMALEGLLRRMNIESTVHGFRSAFRDWCGDQTHFPREIAEAALSHVLGDKAEQAYRRGDALEKRRKLMDAWASYLAAQPQDNVVLLAKAAG